MYKSVSQHPLSCFQGPYIMWQKPVKDLAFLSHGIIRCMASCCVAKEMCVLLFSRGPLQNYLSCSSRLLSNRREFLRHGSLIAGSSGLRIQGCESGLWEPGLPKPLNPFTKIRWKLQLATFDRARTLHQQAKIQPQTLNSKHLYLQSEKEKNTKNKT